MTDDDLHDDQADDDDAIVEGNDVNVVRGNDDNAHDLYYFRLSAIATHTALVLLRKAIQIW